MKAFPRSGHGIVFLALGMVVGSSLFAGEQTPEPKAHYLGVNFKDVKWEKMFPEFGNDSPEISILRVDPKTRATQLLIRTPTAMHVPKHWHSANETHTVISGTITFECDGQRETLGPGSFNYMPRKTMHQAWTSAGHVVFITVDSAWDINWVEGPPTAKDINPGDSPLKK
jgi:quercetin dioxygenase-like cupin family protein